MPRAVAVAVGLSLLTLLGLMGWLWPWRVEISGRARGDSTAVTFALGFSALGFSASLVVAWGRTALWVVHHGERELLRRALTWKSLLARLRRSAPGEGSARLDPWESLLLLWRIVSSWRRVRGRGAITLGLEDPALLAQLSAWAMAISGVIAPLVPLEIDIDWEGASHLELSFTLSFMVRVVDLMSAVSRFLWYHRRQLRRMLPWGAPQLSPKGGHGTESHHRGRSHVA